MVKKTLISIEEQENKDNCGSIEFQVIRFTNKMERLKSHFEFHIRDYLSERGLRKIMRKRERLLDYLSKKNGVRYKELVAQLNIQEKKTRKFEE